MKVQPRDKRTNDENTIIDFALIYESILPKMHFYEIKNLAWLQGYDLISQLILNFKYLGFDFTDLPIAYQSIFGKIEICMAWYDGQLKQKILDFYLEHLVSLGIHPKIYSLQILPTSFYENKTFEKIFRNHEKFGIVISYKIINETKFDLELVKNKRLKDILKGSNKKMLSYRLEWFNHELSK